MSTYQGLLRCPRCRTERADTDRPFEPCGPCRAEGWNVNPLPVYVLTGASFDRQSGQPGIFAWRHLLPLAPDTLPVSLSEGNTPLLPLVRTGDRLGVPDLHLKDESRNPTWSYKDRLISVAVSRAKAEGVTTLAVASTGNHGAAAAAYAAAAGIECIVLTLEAVPLTMKTLMQSYGARVVALKEAPQRWALLREGVEQRGWVPLSGFLNPPAGSNPFGVDGYKTIAYEIVEDLGRAPSVVVVPTSYGDGLAGIARGFEDLIALGVIDTMPRMVASEPFGPYSHALECGFVPGALVKSGRTVAFSIGSPVATFQGYDTLRRADGMAVVTEESRIIPTQLTLARDEGLYLEAASVTGLVAVEELAEQGRIGFDDTVVVIGTSSGLKDIGSTADQLTPVPVVEPSLAALDAALGA